MTTSNIELEAYARQRILHGEKVGFGRRLMKISGLLFGPKIQMQGLGLYAYIRFVEDHVDSGENPEKAQYLLQAELQACEELSLLDQEITTPSLRERQLLIGSLEKMAPWQRQYVLHSIKEILTGISLDNQSIINCSPLERELMQERHLYESMSGFQIMSAVFWKKRLLKEKNPAVEELFRTWILYDALRDLDEDLSAGLILFPKEELEEFNIKLKPGDKVDPNFEDLFITLKPIIARQLATNAKAIFETNIPKIYTLLLWYYFMSRIPKLTKYEYPVKPETTLGGNRKIRN